MGTMITGQRGGANAGTTHWLGDMPTATQGNEQAELTARAKQLKGGNDPINGDQITIIDRGEIWQFNGSIWGIHSIIQVPDATTERKGVVKVGNGLGVNMGTVSLDAEQVIDAETPSQTKAPSSKAVVDYIANLDVDKVGKDGEYLQTIEQKDGKVSATAKNFDTAITETSDDSNAPTSAAVEKRIDEKLEELNTEKVGADGAYIKYVEQKDGKVMAEKKAFDNEIGENPSTTNAPTSAAVEQRIKELDVEKLVIAKINDNKEVTLQTYLSETDGLIDTDTSDAITLHRAAMTGDAKDVELDSTGFEARDVQTGLEELALNKFNKKKVVQTLPTENIDDECLYFLEMPAGKYEASVWNTDKNIWMKFASEVELPMKVGEVSSGTTEFPSVRPNMSPLITGDYVVSVGETFPFAIGDVMFTKVGQKAEYDADANKWTLVSADGLENVKINGVTVEKQNGVALVTTDKSLEYNQNLKVKRDEDGVVSLSDKGIDVKVGDSLKKENNTLDVDLVQEVKETSSEKNAPSAKAVYDFAKTNEEQGITKTEKGISVKFREMTLSEYDALPLAEKQKSGFVKIVDGEGDPTELFDDTTLSLSKGWSSQKISTEIELLKGKLEYLGTHLTLLTPEDPIQAALKDELVSFVRNATTPSREPQQGDLVKIANENEPTSIYGVVIFNGNTWLWWEKGNSSISTATRTSLGVVMVGDNIDLENGKISVKTASAYDKGLVKVNEATGGLVVDTEGLLGLALPPWPDPILQIDSQHYLTSKVPGYTDADRGKSLTVNDNADGLTWGESGKIDTVSVNGSKLAVEDKNIDLKLNESNLKYEGNNSIGVKTTSAISSLSTTTEVPSNLAVYDYAMSKPMVVENLPSVGEKNVFYLMKIPGTQSYLTYAYIEDAWKVIGGSISERASEIGDVVMGNGLINEEKVIQRYGGIHWQQLTGAIFGVGGDINTGVGITEAGGVSQSMPKMVFSGTSRQSTESAGSHSHTTSFMTTSKSGNDTKTVLSYSESKWGSYTRSTDSQGSHSHYYTASGSIYARNANSTATNIQQNGYVRPNGYATFVWLRVE